MHETNYGCVGEQDESPFRFDEVMIHLSALATTIHLSVSQLHARCMYRYTQLIVV